MLASQVQMPDDFKVGQLWQELSALAVAAGSTPNLSVAAGYAETATACREFSPELFNVGPAGRRCAETACVWQAAKVVSPDSAVVCRSQSRKW